MFARHRDTYRLTRSRLARPRKATVRAGGATSARLSKTRVPGGSSRAPSTRDAVAEALKELSHAPDVVFVGVRADDDREEVLTLSQEIALRERVDQSGQLSHCGDVDDDRASAAVALGREQDSCMSPSPTLSRK